MLRQNRWRVIVGIVASMSLMVMVLFTFLQTEVAQATVTQTILHVAPNGDCGAAAPCFDNVQAAVDAAADGDEIRIATGIYTQTHARPIPDGYLSYPSITVITQSVLITKSLDIRGGYTITDWSDSDPDTNATVLDAQYAGRVFLVFGTITNTIEGLQIIHGNADGLGGSQGGDDLGGGMFVYAATITIKHNIFRDNLLGGAVVANSNSTLTDNLFQDNSNTYLGGGAYIWYGRSVIEQNMFANNECAGDLSGRLEIGGGLGINDADYVIVSKNTFWQNTTPGIGGGAYIRAFQATISGNSFIDNVAHQGGGLTVSSGGSVAGFITFTQNIILDNTADRYGGLHLFYFRGILINNVIVNNHIPYNHSRGSGIGVEGSMATILHATINNNTGGDGSGIFGENTTHITMTNSIISNQVIGIYLREAAASEANVDSTLWFNNTFNTGGLGSFTVTNPFQGDPAFRADGYHIEPFSAAIDKGANTSVTEDIDGTPRSAGAAPDLGADEFPEITEWLYLPMLPFPP